ncbi:polysaccharide biosynthesis tyrosine autokinase [Lentibacillus salinarum]|uniref:non-specific protein-tyrosine kinase n=1 Tax=Lentibacillus salinarum TaxID=446820 RepID=A0ABW3ZSC7_9BACI
MEQSFQIKEFLMIFKKRMIFIIVVSLSFTLAGALISYYLVTPVYESRSDLLVNHTATTEDEPLSSTDIEMNLRLIETYQLIIKSKRIRDIVAAELNQTYTSNDLKRKLRVETNADSQIISLYIEDNDPEMAAEIANTFASIFQAEVTALMNMNNVNVLTKAEPADLNDPIRPKPIIYTIVSFLIGIMYSCTHVFLSAYFNTKLSSRTDVEKYLQVPLLGSVGIFSKGFSHQKEHNKQKGTANYLHLISRTTPSTTPAFEAYRTIRTNIQFQRSIRSMQSLLITSSEKGDGKTVTGINLAIVMAIDNKKTVVIDADLRKAEDHRFPGSDNSQYGLTNYLAGYAEADNILSDTSFPNLTAISSGPIPPNPAELLSSERMDQLLEQLRSQFDMIIIDSTPMFFSDPSILATKVDGCVLIVNAGVTKVNHAQQSLEQLKNVDARISGAVLNKKKDKKKHLANYYAYVKRY